MMESLENLDAYNPQHAPEPWTEDDARLLESFVSNLNGSVHALKNLPPEVAGALCSRASRASNTLVRVLLDEYLKPIAQGEERTLARELDYTIAFLKDHGFSRIVNNQRAQSFYAKWLSQYGDDSIAQMTGVHLVFDGLSQVALKFAEDQRIGLEPIEQSTRYVSFGAKIAGKYRYYTPAPDLEKLGLLNEYRATLDHLFDTYVDLVPKLTAFLSTRHEEKNSVLEKKAFDTLRGLLPMATLGQVAFRGNAQAWEFLINRSAKHPLGELRWLAAAIKKELDGEIPSLLLRAAEAPAGEYQQHLGQGNDRAKQVAATAQKQIPVERTEKMQVTLAEFDPLATEKIIAAIIFPIAHVSWESAMEIAKSFSDDAKRAAIAAYIGDRKARWYKVGRAFENAYLRYEIVMSIASYRDLHRHRMMTQERQRYSTHHGYELPKELVEAGLDKPYVAALDRAKELFEKIEKHDAELAQYVVPLAYRIRCMHYKNFRQLFWESELRTGPQGHPEYRFVEQEMVRLAREKFPVLAAGILADFNDYALARRGTEERIAAKEKELIEKLGKKS